MTSPLMSQPTFYQCADGTGVAVVPAFVEVQTPGGMYDVLDPGPKVNIELNVLMFGSAM